MGYVSVVDSDHNDYKFSDDFTVADYEKLDIPPVEREVLLARLRTVMNMLEVHTESGTARRRSVYGVRPRRVEED